MENLVREFSNLVFNKYYKNNFLTGVTENDWKVLELHKTSYLFGFKPSELENDFFNSENDNAIFRIIHNKFDNIYYLSLEKFLPKDREIFSLIYKEFIQFCTDKNLNCFISIFSYDESLMIDEMISGLPMSYTSDETKNIYDILNAIPKTVNDIPTLQISLDGVSYNDYESKFYKFIFSKGSVEVLDFYGNKVKTLSNTNDVYEFNNQFLLKKQEV